MGDQCPSNTGSASDVHLEIGRRTLGDIRKMRTCTRLALALVELALFAFGCSSKSSPPASYFPHQDASIGTGTGGSRHRGSDASTCTAKSGYEQVATLDADWLTDDANVAMVIDGDGNPMVVWEAFDQSVTTLYFRAYVQSTCTWLPAVSIDMVGKVSATQDREVTMTRDASNGQLGVAYQVIDASDNRILILAQSGDNGATWTKEIVVQNPPADTSKGVARPTIAMKNGTTYFAYYQIYLYSTYGANSSSSSGFVLLTRTGSSGPFTSMNIPAVTGANLPGSEPLPPSLAIDDNGAAGLAYFVLTDTTGGNLQLNYFHTARDKSVAVFDSQQRSNDVADVSLIFEGNSPRLAASLARANNDAGQDSTSSKIWFSSSDDGIIWSAPIELPTDGSDAMGPDVALTARGNGTLSIASKYTSGGGVLRCGAPNISTGVGDGTIWATCNPVPGTGKSFDRAGSYVQLAVQPSGKLIAAFAAERQGVWVWREP